MFLYLCLVLIAELVGSDASSALNRTALRLQTVEMFKHAFSAYLTHAWPADELMPLSCKGRVRGQTLNRGAIDDGLGNFSLTLIDSLDTLAVLGLYDEFESSIRRVIDHVRFDSDFDVSVFEVNIRVVGGLISAHVLALEIQHRSGLMGWYSKELLNMAEDIATRLLPAFNTTTGIPHPLVNLKRGMTFGLLSQSETCTACAGSMIMEFAALSRLTENPVYEQTAKRAMDFLWKQRHRGSDLMGTILSVENGDWKRRDSGVGAGIDSYYEYCLKAYILLGDLDYLNRFNKHYDGIMRYINQGHLMVDVQMHRPDVKSKNYMDSLFAFWPGLQVLKGDLKSAIEIHEMLNHVSKKHRFIPEAFTHNFNVHWKEHHLRPEFIESTYSLYKATKDPYYLQVGAEVQQMLNKYARVDCGFAAVRDVRILSLEDRLDSYVFAETFKYLYLLFTDEDDLLININDYVFTTEAHLLPLELGGANRNQDSWMIPAQKSSDELNPDITPECSAADRAEIISSAHQIRSKVRESITPSTTSANIVAPGKLTAAAFNPHDANHILAINKMGINVITMADGRIQLTQVMNSAIETKDAQDGLLFLKDMIELTKQSTGGLRDVYIYHYCETGTLGIICFLRDMESWLSSATHQLTHVPETTRTVQLLSFPHLGAYHFIAFAAQFGPDLLNDELVAEIVEAQPLRACKPLDNARMLRGKIVIVERSECMFVKKATHIEEAGGIGMIVVDHYAGTSATNSPGFAMAGDEVTEVVIPSLFLFRVEGDRLRQLLMGNLATTGSRLVVRLAVNNINPVALPWWQFAPLEWRNSQVTCPVLQRHMSYNMPFSKVAGSSPTGTTSGQCSQHSTPPIDLSQHHPPPTNPLSSSSIDFIAGETYPFYEPLKQRLDVFLGIRLVGLSLKGLTDAEVNDIAEYFFDDLTTTGDKESGADSGPTGLIRQTKPLTVPSHERPSFIDVLQKFLRIRRDIVNSHSAIEKSLEELTNKKCISPRDRKTVVPCVSEEEVKAERLSRRAALANSLASLSKMDVKRLTRLTTLIALKTPAGGG